jgi:hypothetical protein
MLSFILVTGHELVERPKTVSKGGFVCNWKGESKAGTIFFI